MLIRDTLQRDLTRRIEEIIKVDQTDETVVLEELEEYVVTPSIANSYRRVFSAIAEAPSNPTEAVGVWVSGFFGSGKSSFAKNLGYVLEDRQVLGEKASDVFRRVVRDTQVSNLVDSIHSKFPVKVIMFDIQSDRALGAEPRSIAHYMYRVLLRELGYAEDFDLAELEMTLESDGKLPDFMARVQDRYGEPWALRRKMAAKMNEASAILHDMDSQTYPAADSWAKGRAGTKVEATPNLVVERSYELVARRLPGHALVYIIDEVGQYIARNSDRIEDIRRVVELLGAQGRTRVQRHQAASPIWLVATSQERLDEVVAVTGDVEVQLAKVRDRFPIEIDLSPADIREIVVKRVLAKKDECVPLLQKLFKDSEGALKTHADLERTHRRREFDVQSFSDFHPYLPHHIDTLSIDIVSGLRRQPGADRTIGGATRTIIKQAYEMLVNERTRLANAEVGTLVTLDKLYELLEGSISSETRREVDEVDAQFAADVWCSKVIRTIVLLEYVRDLPTTEQNVAALLYPSVGAVSPLPDVKRALGALETAQHIRQTDEGYKVLTAQEKNWQVQKQKIDVRPRQRNELLDQALGEMFAEPALKSYRHQNRNFAITAALGTAAADSKGSISVRVQRSDTADKLKEDVDNARVASRTARNEVFWVFPLTGEVDGLVADLVRSREMVRQYEGLRAQGKISSEESSSLEEEKRHVLDVSSRLKSKLTEALSAGEILVQGRSRDVSSLAPTPSEALRKFLDEVVPDLYPNLGHAAVTPKTNDAEDILKAVNLDGLPAVYAASGLGLFVRSEGSVKFNPDAPVARDLLGYLRDRVDFGEKPTGRNLEDHFAQPPFGWEADVVRTALAGLFRAGAVHITSRGRTHYDYSDEQAWSALTRLLDFRTATFAPQQAPPIDELVKARQAYEGLTGQPVDVDQQKISRALGEFVADELAELPELLANARASRLPIVEALEKYQQELAAIEREDIPKRVSRLAQEGAVLKRQRDDVRQIKAAMTSENIDRFVAGRSVAEVVWPALERAGVADGHEPAYSELVALLESPTVLDTLTKLTSTAESIQQTLVAILDEAHRSRNEAFRSAVDRVTVDERMVQVSEADREMLLRPLKQRICDDFQAKLGSVGCSSCRAALPELESDLAAVDKLEASARVRIVELTTPERRTERVKASAYFGKVETQEDVDRGVEALREDLMKYLSEDAVVIIE